MCPYEINAPTFPPLSQNFQTMDRRKDRQTDKGKSKCHSPPLLECGKKLY